MIFYTTPPRPLVCEEITGTLDRSHRVINGELIKVVTVTGVIKLCR